MATKLKDSVTFWAGVLLMPLAPFSMAWLFWSETDEDGGTTNY